MKNKNTAPKNSPSKKTLPSRQYSYNDVIEFLDANWSTNITDDSLACIKELNTAFGNIANKLKIIAVGGTNGKSLTVHFISKLLKEEGLKVGALYSPHVLTYNERFSLNNETILNKNFTDIANEVINTAHSLGITPNSADIILMIALRYFELNKIDVAVIEAQDIKKVDPLSICSPQIVAITRITDHQTETSSELLNSLASSILRIVKTSTQVISADQSKLNLQVMQEMTENLNGKWAMPIRKLAALSYPFEQLHGRCAALAERTAQIYINEYLQADDEITQGLLKKIKGQRGRPTLETKKIRELNPKKTVEQFWKETVSTLVGRFQLLDKEKPTILLDNASNLDAIKNILLGIRLLHYQRPLKGLTFILGSNNQDLEFDELLKQLRYFFKKTSGQVVVCPVQHVPGQKGSASWDVEKVTNDIKSMKIKAKAAATFKEAFEYAQSSVDERHGLVVITGSNALVTEYWRYKGMKKL